MGSLRFAGALLVAVVAHLVASQVYPQFPRSADLLLVLTVFNGLRGNLAAGMLGGLAAGLVTDALTGGLYGMHGIADTILGYATAFASQRLVIQRATGVTLVFALAAASQQAILVVLALALVAEPRLPDLPWLVLKVVSSGLLGLALTVGSRWARGRWTRWRGSRRARLR